MVETVKWQKRNPVGLALTATMAAAWMCLVMAGCENPVKKEVIGIWKIEDIQYSGDTAGIDREQLRASIENQKLIWFEILEDSVMNVYSGSVWLDGKWWVRRHGTEVYARLEESREVVTLGRYRDGKLISEDTSPGGVTVTTVYYREQPVVQGQDH